MKPRALAPASTAARASGARVIPQILTLGMRMLGCGPTFASLRWPDVNRPPASDKRKLDPRLAPVLEFRNMKQEVEKPSTEGLRRADLEPDPINQFRAWFNRALEANLPEPNAMTLATASRDGA